MVSLIEQVETRVRQTTHDRIRGLTVEESQGRIIIRGLVPSQHTKQLALHGALELLPGDRVYANITVGSGLSGPQGIITSPMGLGLQQKQ